MTHKSNFKLNRFIILIMAITCGATVANLYFIQPLLTQISTNFNISESQAGFIVTLTQIGYALGLFLFVPLGDIKERRNLIIKMLIVVSISLLLVAISPNYVILLIASLLVGFTTIIPQLIVPFAAHLAEPSERGKIIGNVMSGLLIGILLSRTFSGIVGQAFGWRSVYFCAAFLMALFAIIIKNFFPTSIPNSSISYAKLILSIFPLIKQEKTLREASINGALMFGAFSAFWTSVIFLLGSHVYNLGTREAGLLGLIGVAGAAAAPFVGRIADKKTPKFTVGISIIFSTLSYICFFILGYKLYGLIIGVILLDLGTQAGQVSNQARIHELGDEARSRINTVFMVSYFLGGSLGSFLAPLSWQYFGWIGVCSIGFIFEVMALIFHYIIYK
ncbi:MFS transporter [Clostridium beijerinckii]|uniref:MFS transporter n=1 Tax=Clostridium beijerinckii TaxID=1520 RepID=UPI001F349C2B|nr:MFS transporter [Clostridium beijerinckii]